MADTLTFRDNTAALAALGVPASVLEYIKAQAYPRAYRAAYVAYFMGVILVILGVPVGGGLAIFLAASRIGAARANQGYVVVENHGWAAIVVGFGLLFLAGSAAQLLVRGPFAEYCAIRGLLQSRDRLGVAGAITRFILRKAAARVPSGEARAFLHELGRLVARWFAVPGSVLTLIGLVLVPIDLGRYDVADAAGVTHHSVFGASSRSWDDLDHVETGCSVYADNAGEHASAMYTVVFKDGASTSLLLNATAGTIEGVRRIDDLLRGRKFPVKMWARKKGTRAWDDGCVQRVASTLGVNDKTLASLLRPSEQP